MTNGDSQPHGLGYVLELDGDTYEIGDGYWVTFRVKQVVPDAQRPHGLSYALSMHSPGGHRLVGYDNAHLPGELQAKQLKRRSTQPLDHFHYEGRRTRLYQFKTAGDLVIDFWNSVEAKLREEGVE